MCPISQIEPGERVWSYDFQAGSWRLCIVEQRHDNEYIGQFVTLDVGVGEVTATAYHPFWVISGDDLEARPICRELHDREDRGGVLAGRWVNSHEVREGDVVFLRSHGPITVRRISVMPVRNPVCNLTVQGLNNFAVGKVEALVHNTSGSGPAEVYKSFGAAVGEKHEVTHLQKIGPTKTSEIAAHGFTEKWIGKVSDGKWYSAFRNPKTGAWSYGGPSSHIE